MKPRSFASRLAALVVVFSLLIPFASPQPANAYVVPVVDAVNWLLQFIQTYMAWLQRAQAYYVQGQQYAAQIKALRSFGRNGYWTELGGVLNTIDQLFQGSRNIGYMTADAIDHFNEDFPGYKVPVDPIREKVQRLGTAQVTLRQLLKSMNQITTTFHASQKALNQLKEFSYRAESPLEELEVHSMGQVIQAHELNKLVQLGEIGANVSLVEAAVRLQEQANNEALVDNWLAVVPPVPSARDFRHFDPVPAGL